MDALREYATVEFESETTTGYRIHLQGHPHPTKGKPTIEALNAAKHLKRAILTHPWNLPLNILEYDPSVGIPFTQEFCVLLSNFIPIETAHAVSLIFEFDEAYRFRLQDLFKETTDERLATQPVKEILKLLRINKQRDYKEIHHKFQKLAYFPIICLIWPPFRSTWKEAIKLSSFEKLQPDEGDLYWMGMKKDYKYGN